VQFLSPAAIAIAAACTIPPLVALYFLKLKRTVYPISSTLLWKKSIEDLHVNAPFQRLRNSILLWLQLLVLLLAALALGKPMIARTQSKVEKLVLLIDQSASMSVIEPDHQSRLDLAKQQARRTIDAMDANTQAMIIAFCDRATMVSSFDSDKDALKRKIDDIEPTDSTSRLGEAVALAEAFTQNMIIPGDAPGTDIQAPSTESSPAVILFTDGRIEDAQRVSPQRLDLSDMRVVIVGQRRDNVGITAMDARRTYEHPERIQAFATVRNFSDQPMSFDATLYLNDQAVDVQSVELAPARLQTSTSATPSQQSPATASTTNNTNSAPAAPTAPQNQSSSATTPDADSSAPTNSLAARNQAGPAPGSIAAVAFDSVEFEDSGIAGIRLTANDALNADDQAWSIIPPPRHLSLLLVTDRTGYLDHLGRALSTLDVTLTKMTPDDYESAPQDTLALAGRSLFDVVVIEDHDTDRLFSGSYLFWGGIPKVDGVQKLGWIGDQVIVDWEESHPVLRHVPVDNIFALRWLRLQLPDAAERLIVGETDDSTILSVLTRGQTRLLIWAMPFTFVDDQGQTIINTDWQVKDHMLIFLTNAVEFLASGSSSQAGLALEPGAPCTVPIPRTARQVRIHRPDGLTDTAPTAGADAVTYARTRRTGVYRVEPAAAGHDTFAVNLFNSNESDVTPSSSITIGGRPVAATAGNVTVNEPLWPWLVLALLAISLIEWIVYNRRVSV